MKGRRVIFNHISKNYAINYHTLLEFKDFYIEDITDSAVSLVNEEYQSGLYFPRAIFEEMIDNNDLEFADSLSALEINLIDQKNKIKKQREELQESEQKRIYQTKKRSI